MSLVTPYACQHSIAAEALRDGPPKFTLLSVAKVKGRLPLNELEDVDEWIGASGEVSIVVSGFLRRNGRPFAETVELPVTIGE